jgi:ornithine cyclodeaminase
VFTDGVAQAISIGECQHAIADGLIDESDIAQIGAVINGDHPGRSSAEEITLFDGTGVGLQDLAVAAAVAVVAAVKTKLIQISKMRVSMSSGRP